MMNKKIIFLLSLVFFNALFCAADDAAERIPDVVIEKYASWGQSEIICISVVREFVSLECLGMEVQSNMYDSLGAVVSDSIRNMLAGILDFKEECIEGGIPFSRRDICGVIADYLNGEIRAKYANVDDGISSYFYISSDPGRKPFVSCVLKKQNELLPSVIKRFPVDSPEMYIELPKKSAIVVKKPPINY